MATIRLTVHSRLEAAPARQRDGRPPLGRLCPLSPINLLAVRRYPAYLLNQTVFAKCFQQILNSGALRIRDVTDVLRIPRASINALMQYLKRKRLVKKLVPSLMHHIR